MRHDTSTSYGHCGHGKCLDELCHCVCDQCQAATESSGDTEDQACDRGGTDESPDLAETRHAAHVGDIGCGRAGLFLGAGGHPHDETITGPDGYALVRGGAVQYIEEDCREGRYRVLQRDPITGAYILP